jgi:hypothetical protein
MTLAVPTHWNPPRRFRRRAARRTSGGGTAIRLAPRSAGAEQLSLLVEFRSLDGRTWRAIGGGETAADAIDFARASCPTDATWQPAGWNDLYGD